MVTEQFIQQTRGHQIQDTVQEKKPDLKEKRRNIRSQRNRNVLLRQNIQPFQQKTTKIYIAVGPDTHLTETTLKHGLTT